MRTARSVDSEAPGRVIEPRNRRIAEVLDVLMFEDNMDTSQRARCEHSTGVEEQGTGVSRLPDGSGRKGFMGTWEIQQSFRKVPDVRQAGLSIAWWDGAGHRSVASEQRWLLNNQARSDERSGRDGLQEVVVR